MYKVVDYAFASSTFGADVRANRLRCGFTQQELANFIGVDGSLISRIERGRYPQLRVTMLLDMCNLFDLNPRKYYILKDEL